MPRKRMTLEEIAAAQHEARRRMRAGSAAAALTGGATPPSNRGVRPGTPAPATGGTAAPTGFHREHVQREPLPTKGMLTGGRVALDLGQRQNTTQGARAGQNFRDYVSGGTEYHSYEGGPTIAVKARPADKLRELVMAHGQQERGPGTGPETTAPQDNSGQDVQGKLNQLAQDYARQRQSVQRPQDVQRQLLKRMLANRRRAV